MVLIVLFVTGIMLTASGISDIIKLNGVVPDFNYDSMQNIKEGDIVQGYVWNIIGSYANETTTNTTMGIETSSYTSAEYFIMPLINDSDSGKELYITVTARNQTDRNTLYDICDATWEYYIDSNTSVTFPEMGIVAKVKKLDDDLQAYMIDWFQSDDPWFESSSEAKSHIVCYELQIYNPNSAYTSLGIGLVIIALFAVAGVFVYKKLRVGNTSSGTLPYIPQPVPPSAMDSVSAPQNGFAETYTPPSPSAAQYNAAPQNSFSAPTSPQPIPDIPQPVQPDDFFDKSKPVSVPVSVPAPTAVQEPAPQPEPEIPQPVQPDEFFAKPVKKDEPKPAPTPAAAAAPVQESQHEPSAAEAPASADMDGLDTASLSLDDLGYYDTYAESSNEEDDMFDFSNDDYGEIDVSSIEISE